MMKFLGEIHERASRESWKASREKILEKVFKHKLDEILRIIPDGPGPGQIFEDNAEGTLTKFIGESLRESVKSL